MSVSSHTLMIYSRQEKWQNSTLPMRRNSSSTESEPKSRLRAKMIILVMCVGLGSSIKYDKTCT